MKYNPKHDDREMCGSVIAIAGPKRDTQDLWKDLKMFEKVHIFDVPDDYGEFPDTSGYTSDQYMNMESEVEDPSLYFFMTKCVDAVMEFNKARVNMMDKHGHTDIEAFLQTPKFGGTCFAVCGFVRAYPPQPRIVNPEKPVMNLLRNIMN